MTEQEVLELLDKFISTSFDKIKLCLLYNERGGYASVFDLADDIRYAFDLSETEDDFINSRARMHGNDFKKLTK